MCIPGSINNKNTEGVYKLLKNGATMVTSGEDILNALNWEILSVKKEEKEIPKQYSDIYDLISVEPKGFDEIQAQTNLETEELLTLLTMMEVEGFIEQIDGDRYKRG